MSTLTLTKNSHELALELQAAKASGDRELQNEVSLELAPHVRSIATFHATGLSPIQAREFIDESMSRVWSKIHLFDPSKAQFSTWCSIVMRNAKIDELRKGMRSSPRFDRDSDVYAFAATKLKADFWGVPFSAKQVSFLSRWPVQDRVEILAITALCSKLPQVFWTSWLAEYEKELEFRLPTPFPDTRILEEKERMILFCRGGRRFDAVRMNFVRKWLPLLSSIPSIREDPDEFL